MKRVISGRLERINLWKEKEFVSNELQAKVHIENRALATSGTTAIFMLKMKKYAHTIDPKTGYPVQHSLLAATVIAENGLTADGFATTFMVLGLEH